MNSDQLPVAPEAFSAFQDWVNKHRRAMADQGDQSLWDAARAAREAYARQHDVGQVDLADDERLIEAALDNPVRGLGRPRRAEQGKHRG